MARRIPADKIKNRKHPHAWHKEHCKCAGKPMKARPQLLQRQAAYDANKLDSVSGYRRPGSQNRKKR